MNLTKLIAAGALLCSGLISSAQVNNALHFDGFDDYISTSQSGVTGNGARTVEAWILTDSESDPNNNGAQHVILDMGDFVNGQRFTMNLLWANSIRVEIGGSGVSGTVAVNDSNWHHVAVVYNPSNSTKVMLYVDGASAGSGNFTATPSTTSGSILIGRRCDNVKYFDGLIDDVRVWNVARTGAQILSSMNGEVCGAPSGLVAYYQMNEGNAAGNNWSVTTVPNVVGTGSGTLNNFDLSGSASNWLAGQNLNLTKYDSVQAQVCNAFTLPNGDVTDTSGTYVHAFTMANGCDSVVTYDVIVDTVDNRVVQNGIVLSAQSATGSFQWVSCDDSTDIAGATSAVFVVSANGHYAVKVTEGSCEQWSDCFEINNIGIKEDFLNAALYPNPASTYIIVPSLKQKGKVAVDVYTVGGQLVQQLKAENGRIELPQEILEGLYILQSEEHSLRALIQILH